MKDLDLLLEFWDFATKHSSRIWNVMPHGLLVNGTRLIPDGAYEGVMPSMDNFRVFGCVCYSYISSKSWPAGTKDFKLRDRGRESVYLG